MKAVEAVKAAEATRRVRVSQKNKINCPKNKNKTRKKATICTRFHPVRHSNLRFGLSSD